MSIRLLHLSDIHFHASLYPAWDPFPDLGNEVIRDIERLVASGGPMDAILIGGDIAFSATEAEYEIALEWIDRVRVAAGGLDRSKVWTVPGNHDVNRAAISANPDAMDFREAMKACPPEAIDSELLRRVGESTSADEIFAPLNAYNEFAGKFLCTTNPSSPAWEDNSLTVDGWTVYLTGINSVMNSGSGDHKASLIVGTSQCQLQRSPDTIHIAMLHHPPSWIRDWSTVEPRLNRAHVVLFGHEHAFEARQAIDMKSGVQIAAGAVSPERDDRGEIEPFVPTFNLITLSRTNEDQLKVELDVRYWSRARTRFDDHPEGGGSFLVDLDPAVPSTSPAPEARAEIEVAAASPLIEPEDEIVAGTGPDPEERSSLRAIGVAFMTLPVHRRDEIARKLQVVEDEDHAIRPNELYLTILRRIRDAGLIDELVKEIRQ